MLWTIFLIIVGIFIGWNIERPRWSHTVQNFVVAKTRDVVGWLWLKVYGQK